MSSKIPESEWTTVAARRSAGESVSVIARDYGCSPALIYAVLKKAPVSETAPAAVKEQPTLAPAASRPADLEKPGPSARQDAPIAVLEAQQSATEGAGLPNAASTAPAETANPGTASSQEPKHAPSAATGEAPGASFPRSAKPIALTASLDDALRSEAEATILRFRDAFTAALGASNAASLAALRQASSELMRIGARTSIIVERLASTADRPQPGGGPKLGVVQERAPDAVRTGSNGGEFSNEGASSGTVKWFNPEKGFGFVAADEGGDVYVSLRALQNSGLSTLREGQRVRLTTRAGPRGPQAARIELLTAQDV